jgi:hypothetical protein
MAECFSILSWNVRGLNSPARREVVRDMVLMHRPNLVCLQETKLVKPPAATPWIVLGDFNLIYEARDKNNDNLSHLFMGCFHHVFDTCEPFELELQNHNFTWSNGREASTLVRLDRVFYNEEWDLMFTGFRLKALSSSLSDHCPLLLCQHSKPRTKDTFQFENIWPRIPRFITVVQEAWHKLVPGISPLNILHYKLQHTAKALKSWSKKLFGKARLELLMANEIIHHLDATQENMQLTPDEFLLRKDLKARVLGLAAIERSRSRQASWVTWLKEGDACRRNYISCLKKGSDEFA